MRPARSDVLLVGNALLTGRYALALSSLGMTSQSLGDEATWAGHAALAQALTA
jgi:2-keto-3-deoxy-galactonokinase